MKTSTLPPPTQHQNSQILAVGVPPDNDTKRLATRVGKASRKRLAGLKNASETLAEKWAHKQGTPETLERASRRAKSGLEVMHQMGFASKDHLAAAGAVRLEPPAGADHFGVEPLGREFIGRGLPRTGEARPGPLPPAVHHRHPHLQHLPHARLLGWQARVLSQVRRRFAGAQTA